MYPVHFCTVLLKKTQRDVRLIMNFNFDLLVLKFRLEDFPNAVLLPGIVVSPYRSIGHICPIPSYIFAKIETSG